MDTTCSTPISKFLQGDELFTSAPGGEMTPVHASPDKAYKKQLKGLTRTAGDLLGKDPFQRRSTSPIVPSLTRSRNLTDFVCLSIGDDSQLRSRAYSFAGPEFDSDDSSDSDEYQEIEEVTKKKVANFEWSDKTETLLGKRKRDSSRSLCHHHHHHRHHHNIGQGTSPLAAISVICNTMLGISPLCLPWVYVQLGLPLSIFATVFFALVAAFGMYLLVETAMESGDLDASFYSLSKLAFPRRRAILFAIDVLVLLKAFGVGCAFLVVAGDSFPQLLMGQAASLPLWLGGEYGFRIVATIAAVILFVLPASLPKRIRSLRFTNYISLMCTVFVTMVVASAMFKPGLVTAVSGSILSVTSTNASNAPAGTLASATPELKGASSDVTTLKASGGAWAQDSLLSRSALIFPVFLYMFSCAQNLLSLTNEIRDRDPRNSLRVIVSSTMISTAIYIITGVAGYIALGGSPAVEADILKHFDSTNRLAWTAKLLMFLSIIFSFPLHCHAFRRSLWILMTSLLRWVPATQGGLEAKRKERRFLRAATIGYIVTTTILALAVRDLGSIFQLVGLFGCSFVSYVVPAVLYLRLTPLSFKESWKTCGAVLLAALTCCIVGAGLHEKLCSHARGSLGAI